LAGAQREIPVAHVEAGLRSFNRDMPEERNRVVTDHLSTLLLCPTRRSLENLAREGIHRHVHHVGDVMYDAFLRYRPDPAFRDALLARLGLRAGGYAVATIHRRESIRDRATLEEMLSYLGTAAGGLPVLVPVHP